MTHSYQNEIPKARVNITLDVDTHGASKRKELPLKLLLLGDYSCGTATGAIATRMRININKINFNQILQDVSPQFNATLPNTILQDGTDLKVDLTFKNIKDFEPENIARQVPELRQLISMRNLLKDLKANVLDNHAFRKALENILKDNQSTSHLAEELKSIGEAKEELAIPA